MSTRKVERLEAQSWYHGMLPRAEIIGLLEEPGDWLVRATDTANFGKIEIVLSVKGPTDVQHLTIRHDRLHGWGFKVLMHRSVCDPKGDKYFPTVVALIEYYKKREVPGKYILKRPITRSSFLIKHSDIEQREPLGQGNFCDVFKGVQFLLDGIRTVAIKVCRKAESKRDAEAVKKAKLEMLHEAKIMHRYKDPNVIAFYGFAADHPPIMIIMEYCAGGALEEHLTKEKEKIHVTERIDYCRQAASGMSYLQKQHCVHRDLAARNCLIGCDGLIKIADFGLSTIAGLVSEDCGKMQMPVRWMAPETLKRMAIYSTYSDVWSFGVLMYEIFNQGVKPWPDLDVKKVARRIRHCHMIQPPEGAPPPMRKLMSECWQKIPTTRPDFVELVKKIAVVQESGFPPPALADYTMARLPGVNMTVASSSSGERSCTSMERSRTDSERSRSVSPRSAPDVFVASRRRVPRPDHSPSTAASTATAHSPYNYFRR